MVFDKAGNMYVYDFGTSRLLRITPKGEVRPLVGSGSRGYRDGPADQSQFNRVLDYAIDTAGDLYLIDSEEIEGRNYYYIRKVFMAGTSL